jgi:hypothetical protein
MTSTLVLISPSCDSTQLQYFLFSIYVLMAWSSTFAVVSRSRETISSIFYSSPGRGYPPERSWYLPGSAGWDPAQAVYLISYPICHCHSRTKMLPATRVGSVRWTFLGPWRCLCSDTASKEVPEESAHTHPHVHRRNVTLYLFGSVMDHLDLRHGVPLSDFRDQSTFRFIESWIYGISWRPP